MNPSILLHALLLLLPAGVAHMPVLAWKAVNVGDSVMLPVTVPKGVIISNLILRASSRGEGVAIWMASKVLSVMSTHYSNRVTFLDKVPAFRIANLSLGDGGTYEISANFATSEMVLGTFTVAVFNITKTVVSLDNSSCSIDLLCKAGMGSKDMITYSWKDTDTGIILTSNVLLHWIVHTNEEVAYTCTAQIPTTQSAMTITLKQPCPRSSAVPGSSALGLASLLARGLLVPAVTAAVLLL
ncbi:SLAM family member 5-like [Candoia aspera]|uniref:SLAM family member 5-like n=1 Tax=Candoia aspera TaxID=51853 RepID=UPI002FD864AC